KRAYCLKIQPATGSFARNLIYSTKPFLGFVHLQSVLVEISSSPEKYYKLRIHQERVMEGMMPEEPKAIVIEDTEWGCIHSQALLNKSNFC
ncbi:hypothetical protein ACTXP3_26860, partial [Klebsiella pneumoniae]